jgi:hypothetical protein
MIVYLWTANGRRSHECGVSGSLAAAQEAAGGCLQPGRASSAWVESARLGTSALTLEPEYKPTGEAWRARRVGRGGLQWKQAPTAETAETAETAGRVLQTAL